METTGAVVTTTAMDEGYFEKLGGYVSPEDAAPAQVPVLKMNYDAESKHPRGAWVVGQQKDKEGNIVAEGDIVKGLVILTVRNRFAYFMQGDMTKNCQSPLHTRNDSPVRGSKYGYVCGRECPYRNKEITPHCKAQHVVYGVALTEGGASINCQAYISGDSYMPFSEYYKTLTRKKTKGGYVDVPPFYAVTLLGSLKKKNAGTTYFQSVFSEGGHFAIPQVEKYAETRDAIQTHIDRLLKLVKPALSPVGSVALGTGAPIPGKTGYMIPEVIGDEDVPFDLGVESKTAGKSTATFDTIKDEDFDIEAAVKKILGGGASPVAA